MDSRLSSSTLSISRALALGVFLLLKCLNLDIFDKLIDSMPPFSDDSIEEGMNFRDGTKSLPFLLMFY